MKRVLLALGLSGFGALTAAAMLPPDAVIGLAALCAAAGLLGLCLPTVRRRSLAYGAGLLAAAAALCLFAQKEIADYRPAVSRAGQTVWIEATVAEPPTVSDEWLICEALVRSGDLKPGTRITYGMPWDDEPPSVGDTVAGTVRLGMAASAADDPTAYLGGKASGIYVTAYPARDGAAEIRPSDPSLAPPAGLAERASAALRAFRETAQAGLTAALPDDVRALISAMCLGRRSELPGAVNEAFRKSGVSHLLVVSGLHVSLISMGLYTLLRRVRCRKRTASIAALIGVLLFGCLIGWHASVVRACVLNAAVLLGRCFRRPADSLNSLGGGLLALWLNDPFCVYDLGLWMSFGATAGILFLYPWLWERLFSKGLPTRVDSRAVSVYSGCVRSVFRVVCVTVAATLPILPLIACFFGEVSLIAPLTNLLAVWAAAAILYLACATLLLCALGLGVAAAVPAVPMTALARYLLWVTRTLSGAWGAVWNTRSAYVQVWIVGGLLLLWLGWRLCRGRGLRIAAAVCVIVLCANTLIYTARMQGVTTLTAYNRYGQMTAVAQRDGHAIVIVSGRPRSWTVAERLLREQDAAVVDAVIITDPKRLSAGEWADFDARVAVGRYWLTELNPEPAARLLTGRAPVSVAAFAADRSADLWQDAAWRWEPEIGTLLFCFGDSRAAIRISDVPETPVEVSDPRQALVLTVSAWTDRPLSDDTPVPGRRRTWYTRGQGAWVT